MKIYLACPYTSSHYGTRQARFEAANKMAAKIIKQGHVVFSPISHSHHISLQADLGGNWGMWMKQDLSFLEWCDEVWVLMIQGWKESEGVEAEIAIAEEMGKKVVYL